MGPRGPGHRHQGWRHTRRSATGCGIGTSEGIRFKSARTRGGFVEDVLIRDLTMEKVSLPFTFSLNWNPGYSYASIPKDIKNIPPSWTVLAMPVIPAERGLCEIRNITIQDVEITGARRIFSAAAFARTGSYSMVVKWPPVSRTPRPIQIAL